MLLLRLLRDYYIGHQTRRSDDCGKRRITMEASQCATIAEGCSDVSVLSASCSNVIVPLGLLANHYGSAALENLLPVT